MEKPIELYITSRGRVQEALLEDKIIWETSRIGSPGILKFKVLNDDELAFWEGDEVIFKYNKNNIFFGYVFSKKRDKEQLIDVTCYDQLRYFKNKDTLVYKNKTASDVLAMIISKFGLKAGNISETGYLIKNRIQDNKTLFDIVYDALDLTILNTNKMYCLYDNFGGISLKNVKSMKIDDLILNIDEKASNIENYDYKTDIDSKTYNKIILYKDNEKTGKRELWISQDSGNINKWGILQYIESVDEDTNPKSKADSILALKNKVNRQLSLKGVLGDVRARAGTSPLVHIKEIGDINIAQFMLIEKAKHIFTTDLHTMDLTLRGNI